MRKLTKLYIIFYINMFSFLRINKSNGFCVLLQVSTYYFRKMNYFYAILTGVLNLFIKKSIA